MGGYLIKHSLRASAGAFDSYSPKGWSPQLQATVMGPTPSGAEVVMVMQKPDGNEWFELRTELDALAEEEMKTLDFRYWEAEGDIAETGDVSFALRLVSELEGIDEVLHEGVLTVSATGTGDEKSYVIDSDWLLPLGLVALDVYDEKDAPKLRVTVFLGGGADSYQCEAHLFHDGKNLKQASYVSRSWGFSDNRGKVLGGEIVAEWDEVRGWNNLAESDPHWGQGWHILGVNPGKYEVKFLRDKKVVRIVPFEVEDGRITKVGRIEPDGATRPTMWAEAKVQGTLDGKFDKKALKARPAYGGDLTNGAIDWNSDGMYWYWAGRTAGEGGGEQVAEGAQLDEETAAALETMADKAKTLLNNWEQDLVKAKEGNPPTDFHTACEVIIIPDVDGWEKLRKDLKGVPDDTPITLYDESTPTLAEVTKRVLALRDDAQGFLGGKAQAHADALAPYREVLKNDKLAVFEDHPADGFRYYTTNKKVIETPEELAKAKFWYFEGTTEVQGTATVDGDTVKVSVQGWRVLGWKFDAKHNTVDEFEEQGEGANAPKTAFKHK